MRIISRKRLVEFWARQPESKEALEAWFKRTEASAWKNPADIKEQYRSASFLQNNHVVFNICGNKFRLVVTVNYKFAVVYIRFVGSHSEYDKIDADTI